MFDFCDWGSWGVGDFYDKNEKELKDAVESGKPFDTGWHGFKKEIQSMRISRDEDSTLVEVSEAMDEVFEETDLFCDFLTDKELDNLSDEMINEIREYLMMGDFVEETDSYTHLSINATFEEIMKTAIELANDCSEKLHDSFLECIGTTLYVMYQDNPNRDEIVNERIEKYK